MDIRNFLQRKSSFEERVFSCLSCIFVSLLLYSCFLSYWQAAVCELWTVTKNCSEYSPMLSLFQFLKMYKQQSLTFQFLWSKFDAWQKATAPGAAVPKLDIFWFHVPRGSDTKATRFRGWRNFLQTDVWATEAGNSITAYRGMIYFRCT